jgi:hypothetical protein
MNFNLYVNYFSHSNPARKKELDHCLKANITNPLLNVIVLEGEKRLKYSEYFNIIRRYTSFDDINIIANLDIYFDQDSLLLCSNMSQNDFYTLCRWDVKSDGTIIFWDRPDSQDVWIMKGAPRGIYGEFELGKLGCDNRLVHEAKQVGYNVKNPSLSIRTFHLHNSNIRNYTVGDTKDIVPGPHEKINPCYL